MPSRRIANPLVLLAYTAISFAYFGWRLLPHPGRYVLGSSQDPEVYVWSLGWWPHAIAHWLNPFVSHAAYSPTGVNLAWVVSVPALAVAFWPITALFGPVVSYNVASMLLPALAAWTAFLLCRYLTRSVWASLVGGYLFGFSASVLRDELWGNFHVSAVFLFPLIALVIVRFVREDLSPRWLVWRLGLLLAAQLWMSTEYAFTVTVVVAVGLGLASWLIRDARARIRASLVPVVEAYALAGVLSAPLLVYALLGYGHESVIAGQSNGGDLLNFVVPTRAIALGGSSFTSLSSKFLDGGGGLYLGLPTLLIVGAFAVSARRAAAARALLAALVVISLIALGPELLVDSRRVVALPWDALTHLPGFSNSFSFRFSAYAALAAAVIVALWTATTSGRIFPRPYLLPALAIVALVPASWQPFYYGKPSQPAFFTDGLYKTCIPRNETVAAFPFGIGGTSLIWQAESGYWFRLAGDGLAPFGEHGKPLNGFDEERVVWELVYGADQGTPTTDRLLAFAATHHVGRFLALPSAGYPSRAQMERFGPTQLIGGMLVSPACGKPPLTTRNLTSYVEADPHETVGGAPNVGYCLGVNFTEIPEGLDPAGQLAGARRAIYVAGQGLTCAAPPAGYTRHGFASPALSVPADTYAFYSG